MGIARAGLGRALLPGLGAAAHALDDPVNLPRRDGHAARFFQMPLGFQIDRLIGSFQTNELGQGRRVTHLQTQRRVRRIMAFLLSWVVIHSRA
jgi:hypothetical protein